MSHRATILRCSFRNITKNYSNDFVAIFYILQDCPYPKYFSIPFYNQTKKKYSFLVIIFRCIYQCRFLKYVNHICDSCFLFKFNFLNHNSYTDEKDHLFTEIFISIISNELEFERIDHFFKTDFLALRANSYYHGKINGVLSNPYYSFGTYQINILSIQMILFIYVQFVINSSLKSSSIYQINHITCNFTLNIL